MIIRFEIIPPPEGSNNVIEFDADINTMGARFTPGWDTFMEIGRADPKIMFNRFVKEVDLDFTVVAKGLNYPSETFQTTVQEVFYRLEDLSRATRPAYYNGRGYQGHFIKFTIGNIYVNQIGYISNLQYTWENDKITWIDDLPVLTRANMTIQWIGRYIASSRNGVFRDSSATDNRLV